MVPLNGEAIRSRVQGLWNGIAMITLVVDKEGTPISELFITTTGMLEPYEEDDILDAVADNVFAALERLPKKKRESDNEISETIRITSRRAFRRLLDKKPITDVHLVRV
jgi:ribonuclease J